MPNSNAMLTVIIYVYFGEMCTVIVNKRALIASLILVLFHFQEEYDSVLQSAEQKKLTDLVSSLSETDKEEVFRKGLELLEDQNTTESADCLPTVLLSGKQCTLIHSTVLVIVILIHYRYYYIRCTVLCREIGLLYLMISLFFRIHLRMFFLLTLAAYW